MNTRPAIQPSNDPTVLSLSFSASRKRFIAGLSDGLRVLRTDNCLTTYTPSTIYSTSSRQHAPFDGAAITVATALDDRYIAFTTRERRGLVVSWDCLHEREVQRFDFGGGETVQGLRVTGRWMVVVLRERSVIFSYQELLQRQEPTPPPDDDDDDREGSHEACLSNQLLTLPAQTPGQVQLIPLPGGSKRIIRAHNTALRCMTLSPSGALLATASEQGTLIRVFSTSTLEQVAEFRRGVEKAVVFGLAFSDGGRWTACTSDKGTVHVFDLRPPVPPTDGHHTVGQRSVSQQQQHRKSSSHPPTQPYPHRLSTGTTALESLSGRSSPSTITATAHHGASIQEYYSLRPIPSPVPASSPPAVSTAFSTFKHSAWAPKVFKDVRSVASTTFFMGSDDGASSDGGGKWTWTMTPDGTRKRVRRPAGPAQTGNVPRGVLAFAPQAKDAGSGDGDNEGAVVYVLSGGSDARWEIFDLLPSSAFDGGGTGWVLVRRGFRRFLGRQFVD
ncbi:Phosphatidylinositol 3,5-bisphosphate-binding protein [Vermiconidia calcicola]|uniref:Phosphatidylinositol 3,5-bisphosphate-binding protein n=1 Tax=Vermiconidia calcicola TaxID=1690605 RepID=A0ACC3NK80_9PEZI|nr:Phosphatidylinositol 3,5-bisphosphate-binding protein [Vermiconidia calcicola]